MKSLQETETKAAKEYYAFIFEEEEQEQTIDNAVGVVDVGKLTDEQYNLLTKKCQKQSLIESFEYPIKFIDRQSIPVNIETELNFLLDEFKHLGFGYKDVLCIVLRLAKAVRDASEKRKLPPVISEPLTQESADVADSEPTSEPTTKPDMEDPADEVARLLKEGKGDWVEQAIFLDIMKKANPYRFQKIRTAKRALEEYRAKDNVVWSKKNQKIGKDKAGNILEQSGDRKVVQSLSYRYFLSNKSDNIITPTSHSTPPLQ